jgi:hypothetical protein
VKHRFWPLKWASPNRARRRRFSGCTSNKKGDEFEAVTVRTVYSHLDYIEGSEPLAIRLWSSLPTLISGPSAFQASYRHFSPICLHLLGESIQFCCYEGKLHFTCQPFTHAKSCTSRRIQNLHDQSLPHGQDSETQSLVFRL